MVAMQSNFDSIIEQLDYAKEQLDLADDLGSRSFWSDRCDQLESTVSDMLSNLDIL